jgi:hypothetical protein
LKGFEVGCALAILMMLPLALWLGLVGQLILRGGHAKAVFWVGAILVAVLEPISHYRLFSDITDRMKN